MLLRQAVIDALQPGHAVGEILVPLLGRVKEPVLVERVGLIFSKRHYFLAGSGHGILPYPLPVQQLMIS